MRASDPACGTHFAGKQPLPLITEGMIRNAVARTSCVDAKPLSAEDLHSRPATTLPLSLFESPAMDGNSMEEASDGPYQRQAFEQIELSSVPLFNVADGSEKSYNFGVSAMSTVSSDGIAFPHFGTGCNDVQPLPGIIPQVMTQAMIQSGRDHGEIPPSASKQPRRNGVAASHINKLSSEDIKSQRAKRNRESAKRSRLKTKLMHQAMSETFERLQDENRALRAVIDKLLSSSETAPREVQERLRTILHGRTSTIPDASLPL